MGWAVTSLAGVARLIGRKGGPKVLEEGDPITKMKKILLNVVICIIF